MCKKFYMLWEIFFLIKFGRLFKFINKTIYTYIIQVEGTNLDFKTINKKKEYFSKNKTKI